MFTRIAISLPLDPQPRFITEPPSSDPKNNNNIPKDQDVPDNNPKPDKSDMSSDRQGGREGGGLCLSCIGLDQKVKVIGG